MNLCHNKRFSPSDSSPSPNCGRHPIAKYTAVQSLPVHSNVLNCSKQAFQSLAVQVIRRPEFVSYTRSPNCYHAHLVQLLVEHDSISFMWQKYFPETILRCQNKQTPAFGDHYSHQHDDCVMRMLEINQGLAMPSADLCSWPFPPDMGRQPCTA